MLIEFLGYVKLATPGTGCRSWPVAPVSHDSFARRTRIVMPDTARWDGSQPCALARGSDRCAPTLPSPAHEEWRPSVLLEPRAPEVDEKNCETNPITSAGILAIATRKRQDEPGRCANQSCLRSQVTAPRSPAPAGLRRHRFPRSHGPPERRLNGQWLSLRCPFFWAIFLTSGRLDPGRCDAAAFAGGLAGAAEELSRARDRP
jgi:hypothetical protein